MKPKKNPGKMNTCCHKTMALPRKAMMRSANPAAEQMAWIVTILDYNRRKTVFMREISRKGEEWMVELNM